MVANGKNSGGNGGGRGSWGFASLIRRKQVDSAHVRREGHTQLARKLSAIDLIAIGAGATIGAGVYILVGTVSREHTGPALTISFLIAGIAAALSAFCYAELACRCPSAGSAYHYAYICVGEGFGWLVGWALILEYTIGGSAVARGITPNLVSVHKTKGVEVQISGGKCITLNLNNSIIVIPDWNFQLSTDTFN